MVSRKCYAWKIIAVIHLMCVCVCVPHTKFSFFFSLVRLSFLPFLRLLFNVCPVCTLKQCSRSCTDASHRRIDDMLSILGKLTFVAWKIEMLKCSFYSLVGIKHDKSKGRKKKQLAHRQCTMEQAASNFLMSIICHSMVFAPEKQALTYTHTHTLQQK